MMNAPLSPELRPSTPAGPATGVETVKSDGKKTFVLCFDGTGNKFSGTSADSNILKIYRMLDRTRADQFHYYQPGIGTYVQTTSLDHTSVFTRFKSWYDKAKDSAVGTSFANHVMAGYRFLMRYYSPEDDIYFFGFSRGAYTARFLAEMLDHVGLLTAGNEEMCRFAWKTFSKWQARQGGNSPAEIAEAKKMYEFMQGFRETFSRPVKRLRFLGLFDTVNSVPRFESAMMARSKFPYTARTSAKYIRHAVAINERRAKFRQDLVTGSKRDMEEAQSQNKSYRADMERQKENGPPPAGLQIPTLNLPDEDEGSNENPMMSGSPEKTQPLSLLQAPLENGASKSPVVKISTDDIQQQFSDAPEHQHELNVPSSPQASAAHHHRPLRSEFMRPVRTISTEQFHDGASVNTPSMNAPSVNPSRRRWYRRYSDHTKQQDIEEVWFPGCHADIGGGWEKAKNEIWPTSHAPLVWMVHEAEAAGLQFDQRKMADLFCCPDKVDEYGVRDEEHAKTFHDALHQSGVGGFIHDCLKFGGGLSAGSVLSWRMMEYLPFRRMDLKPDGMWEAIRWPLPRGETRDIPENAKIHVSAIRRMENDEHYRPGNLIIGGGGRGKKTAGKKYGIGEWDVYRHEGDPVREQYVRRWKPKTTMKMGQALDRERRNLEREMEEKNGGEDGDVDGNGDEDGDGDDEA